MKNRRTFADMAQSCLLAAGGVLLYVPVAIGLAVEEIRRKPEYDDDRWRFVLPGVAPCLGPTAKKDDMWAHMNLTQYFSLSPGATALDIDNCAFSRRCYA
jgi:hypothetical protein